ncbi:MAG: hypothetical protein RIQ81_180, partial [Pseudomonadota bacterium]
MQGLPLKTVLVSICLGAAVASAARQQQAAVDCPSRDRLGLLPAPVDVRFAPLSSIAPGLRPGEVPYANSERTPPFQTGRKALPHLRSRIHLAGRPAIRRDQRVAGEAQLQRLARELSANAAGRSLQFEGWPTRSALGEDTWTWARYRVDASSPWIWLGADVLQDSEDAGDEPHFHLPVQYDTASDSDHHLIFDDFLDFDDLDSKPVFGDIIWVDQDGGNSVLSAWNNPDLRPLYAQCAPAAARRFGIELPQPALFNDAPVSFVANVSGDRVEWLTDFDVAPAMPPSIGAEIRPVQVTSWLPDFQRFYRDAVSVISGDSDALFPISGTSMRFTRKSSAQVDHHLEYLNDFLEETYRK